MLCLWCNECYTCASCTYVMHMCKLLPYLIYAQHVCYLCTQHVLLAHIHATGMLHKCFLHVCMLQRAAYMPLAHMQATSIPHMCSLHTCMLLQCCIHAAYISATLLHILGMYTAYILHTCTPAHVTHVCCTHAAHTIHQHIACMCVHKNWFSTIRMPYKHMKKCMQFVCNYLHAACMLYI